MRVIKVYKVDEQANKATSQGEEQKHYNKNLIPTKEKSLQKIPTIMRNSKHWQCQEWLLFLYVNIQLTVFLIRIETLTINYFQIQVKYILQTHNNTMTF